MFPGKSVPPASGLDRQNCLSTIFVFILLLAGAAATAQAATIVVPAGGNVQAAVNAAQCGDTIALQAGASFPITGRLTFGDKGASCTQYITVTTTDPSSIPAVLRTAYPNSYNNRKFTRMTPALAATMPKLVSLTNDPVIFLDRFAHHWKFVGLELTTADNGIQHTVLVNDGSTNVSDIPHHIIFDQLYLHPAEEVGDVTTNIQYRSTEMAFIISGDFLTISRSAIQGFTGHNRYPTEQRGAYRLNANSILFIFARNCVVENNLLEANGQIFLAGGGGVNPAHTAKATNVTYTSATLSNTKNLDVGDLIAIYSRGYSENHIIQHPGNPSELVPRVGHYVNGKITSVDHASGKVTFTHLTGGLAYRQFNVRLWGATGGTFTLKWMGQTTGPIAYNATPEAVKAALVALPNVSAEDLYVRGGASRGGGWPYGDYEIHFGKNELGQTSGQWKYPTPVNPPSIGYANLTGYQFQPWIAVHSAENFSRLENSADGTLIDVPDEGANVQWEGYVSDNNLIRRNIIAHHPEWTAMTGDVKGFAEVKGGTRTFFDGNIFSGQGTTIIWTVRNQGDGGSAPWSDDSYSQVTNNIFDVTGYTNGFFLRDPTYENIESHDILLSNNLFVNPDFRQSSNPWINLVNGYNVTITHNTVFAAGRLIQGMAFGPSRDAVIKNNIFMPAGYLVPCLDGFSPCWPNASVSHNLIINNSRLEPGSINAFFETFGSGAGWIESSIGNVGFTSPSALLDITGNYRLSPGSQYRAGGARQASDGKDVGVDFDQLYFAVFGVGTPPPPPSPTPTPSSTPTPTPTPTASPTPAPTPTPTAAPSQMTVTMTNPATTSSTFPVGTNVTLGANVSHLGGGVIRNVRFDANLQLIGTATTTPYSITWTNIPAGMYSVSAVASDSQGNTASSSPITVKISKALKAIRNTRKNASGAQSSITSPNHAVQSGSEIDALVSALQQTYFDFQSERGMFESANQIDKYLFAALFLARSSAALAKQPSQSSAVADRMSKLDAYLSFCEDLMVHNGITDATFALTGAVNARAALTITQLDTRSLTGSGVVSPASVAKISATSSIPFTSQTETQHGGRSFELGHVSVTINGRAAEMLSVSPAAITFTVPADLQGGLAEVIVTSREGYISYGTASVSGLNPMIVRNAENSSLGVILNALNVNSGTFSTLPGPHFFSLDTRPRLSLMATGLSSGLVNTDSSNDLWLANGQMLANLAESVVVEARKSNGTTVKLHVEYAGVQGILSGLDQITVILPPELAGAGSVELTLIAGGVRSNPVTIAVQ